MSDPRKEALLALRAAGVKALPATRKRVSAVPSAAPAATPAATPSVGPEPGKARRQNDEHRASSIEHRNSPGCGSPELLAIRETIGDCRLCRLCEGRTKLVFGTGNPAATLLFVGEGPGADEDAQGEPFVGRAGQLLTKIIVAMGFRREEVYIANVVKCRPPDNRKPALDEMATCRPFLFKQIAAIKPRVIVALGATAVEGLTGEKDVRITRRRGQWFPLEGVPVMPTYHPSYILRQGGDTLKSEAGRQLWDDMKAVLAKLSAAG